MDPALQEMLEGEAAEEIEAIVKLKDPLAIPAKIRPIAAFGAIVTCRIQRRYIHEVWGHPDVVSFKAPRLLAVEPDVIESDEALDLNFQQTDDRRQSGLNATGRGIIIGIIDVGCDFTHPNFRNDDGSTRILALWDQSNTTSLPYVKPYNYGVVYSREQINRALDASNPYEALGYNPVKSDPRGIGAHGTLVMDIAAGNGRIPGSPVGISPEADLIFVHVNSGSLSGEANLGDSVRMLEALDFINRMANETPYCVNISLGRRAGSHDGLSLVEQGMDALLLERPGRAIIISAGNYFSSNAHASGQLRPGQRRTITWRIDRADITPNELEIWYSGKDSFAVELVSPGGSDSFHAALGEGCPVIVANRTIGHIYHRFRDPNNGDHHINIFLKPPASAGSWQVILIGGDVVDGAFHAWVERDIPCSHCDSRFDSEDTDPASTTGTICNGLRTISVGAYNNHSLGKELADFSSSGPTRDHRLKPDLIAPGVKILGARSNPGDTQADIPLLTRMSGTSFAAPHVTGTIALMFETAGRPMAIKETRRLLLENAQRAAAEDQGICRVGCGYLDITSTLSAVSKYYEARSVIKPVVDGVNETAVQPIQESGETMDNEEIKLEDLAIDIEDDQSHEEVADPGKKIFILLSGGPGPYDDRDPEHDKGWGNYVTPPLLKSIDSSKKIIKFWREEEEVWWLIYKTAYVSRWDSDLKDKKRIKAVEDVKKAGANSYVDLIAKRAKERNWNLVWLGSADDFWERLRSCKENSISRLWYWGHARDDLWLSLRHEQDGTPIIPKEHEIISKGKIDPRLKNRFQKGTLEKIHRFVGCNTDIFAEKWAKSFEVYAEGVKGKVDFSTIHTTGGEPALTEGTKRQLFNPAGRGYSSESFEDSFNSLESDDIKSVERFMTDQHESDQQIDDRSSITDYQRAFIRRIEDTIDKTTASRENNMSTGKLIADVISEVGIDISNSLPLKSNGKEICPTALFKRFLSNYAPMSVQDYDHVFKLVIGPGTVWNQPIQQGDLLVRIAHGQPGFSHLAIVVAPDLWRYEQLVSAGLKPEGKRPGRYAHVIEGGAFPHKSSDCYARLILEPTGRMPSDQMVLRLNDQLYKSLGSLPTAYGAPSLAPKFIEYTDNIEWYPEADLACTTFKAADAKWAPDSESPDLCHLGVSGTSQAFDFNPAYLERLCILNHFALPKDTAQPVLFGLRGCNFAEQGYTGDFTKSIRLTEDLPDHYGFHCVLGVWSRSRNQFALFKGSTVPNWNYMSKQLEKCRSGESKAREANMLPCGRYFYTVGKHRNTPGAFILSDEVVVCRTNDDLIYKTSDLWDKCTPADNIHPSYHPSYAKFSSAGCQTVNGTYSNSEHKEEWSKFRERAGLGPKDTTKQVNGKDVKFIYILLTGREARLISTMLDSTQLTRIRFGSSGSSVEALQIGLERIDRKYNCGKRGIMDPETSTAYIKWQKDHNQGSADGVVTPAIARAFGFDLVKQQSIAA
jgi:subtilisin family serine protease